jgi:anti-anti-sigma factor
MSEIIFQALEVKVKLLESKKNKFQILTFIGQINQDNAYSISEDINIFFQSETFNTILDLTSLEYINSIGLASLLSIIQKVEENSGRLMIGGINSKIEIIIQLLDLTNRVEIFSSAEKAIAQI